MPHQTTPPNHQPSSKPRLRLSTYLSQAGVVARRAAERHITEGRVTVNGRKVTTLPAFVDPGHDTVAVDGVVIGSNEAPITYALYKPRGVVSTMHDDQGRKHLADLVPATPRVFPIGRLDQASEGLILLTNDGELALRLAHPRYEHAKRYRVWTSYPNRPLPAILSAVRSPRRI